MKLLITGADGLLGSQIVPLFVNDKYFTSVTTVSIQDFDIRDKGKVIEKVKEVCPDVVIHLAAWVDVDGCEKKQKDAMEINYFGVQNIVEACRGINAKLIFISTDYIFDGVKPPFGGYLENSTTNPLNIYGKAKQFSELYIRNNLERHIIIRTAWLFGGGTSENNFILKALDSFVTKNTFGAIIDQIGSPTYSIELGECISKIMKLDNFDKINGTYHIANTGFCSWYDQAKKAIEIKFGVDASHKVMPVLMKDSEYFAKRPRYSVLNTDKLFMATGIRLLDWESALKRYLEDLK